MATQTVVKTYPGLEAGVNLTGSQFRFAIFNASGKVRAAALTGSNCIGVIQNAPAVTEAASVSVGGSITKLEVGEAVAVGDAIITDGNGKGIVRTLATQAVLGRALTAASADGELIELLQIKEGTRT